MNVLAAKSLQKHLHKYIR